MSVSVVIPSYNRATRLPAAIDSVLRQSHDDLEILVVDDGSTDDTRAVVQRYAGAIAYIYQQNAGAGAARNRGIRHASKEFVAFIDSDDRWYDFKLSAQLALFRARPDIGLVFSNFVIERPGKESLEDGASVWAGRKLRFPDMDRLDVPRPQGPQGASWPTPSLQCWAGPMYSQLIDELPILTSSVMVRRSVLNDRTWYSEAVRLFEDWEFFALVARSATVGYIDAPTAVNVGHADPGRLSKCSALERAQGYQRLLERVWLDDAEFVTMHGEAARSAYGRALLAVARESVLAGRGDLARRALRSWRSSHYDERRAWASLYSLCAWMPAGRTVLKQVLRARTMARLVTGAAGRAHAAVNPAV